MYRHILVPLHSGDLAFESVGRALALARPLGARVTFFHAIEDAAGPTAAEPEFLTLAAPQLRDTSRTGRTRELLARAEAGARALGVPCDARWCRGHPVAAATVAAAHAFGCDVIFLVPDAAARADTGIGSVTLSVLAAAGLPVLVGPVVPLPPEQHAIGVILDEHRAIASVIHACTSVLATAREDGSAADPAALRAGLECLRSAPLGLHHAKEEEHLFSRLRERSAEFSSEFDELRRQHARDAALLDQLALRLVQLEDAPGESARIAATRSFEQAMEHFAELHWDHMGREEAAVLPAARQLLKPQDWAELDAAFAHAPLIAANGLDFQPLLTRIGGNTSVPENP